MVTESDLIARASALVGEFRTNKDCVAGSVGAAILTRSGAIYTGVCIDTACSMGFCAEHAAVAEMLKARESEIALVVAVTAEGVIPPCGRCRELMWQVDARNRAARVIIGPSTVVPLADLLPHPWCASEIDLEQARTGE